MRDEPLSVEQFRKHEYRAKPWKAIEQCINEAYCKKDFGIGVCYLTGLTRERSRTVKTKNCLITENDHERLLRLINSRRQSVHERETLDALEQELDRATIVKASEIPHDVVTMNSHVRVNDLDRNHEIAHQIVFPPDADASRNRISVLAPIGTGLLGYRAGDIVEWPVSSGMRCLGIVQ
jgi:regulator of nucleoside diphosphate kinase